MIRFGTRLAGMLVMLATGATAQAKMEMRTFPVLAGAGAHDVYPALDGTVWFTAQSAGKLGRLDPRSGKSDLIALGPSAAPRDCWTRRHCLGHRRGTKRDRPRGSGDPRCDTFPAP